ncbi:hypothetical protein [Burkholderia pseudomallei]|uniref:hypothetical protein n=1 Tax=Burkholderia pseudomallei TaxID=28450 RepID=UPI000B31DA72|nr:hypothetical protein [Burkholderia pseudomallei]MBF3424856.1 hypothetical protein [Burkholderia pseudomallei]MBF3428971.1 hypothetical protein [Burkholderia pseudomallei]MBF3543235.1 hypothetical protein [Burkholderia pseudomallei]MBF3549481.1 hypothetical protein [Burkholderia pseudomallei]MBF3585883.1 hypothetical protein [Burkholderia pseudomallei]
MSSARGARLKAGDPRGGFPFGGMNGRRRCRCPMSIRHADAGFTAKKRFIAENRGALENDCVT